jgi:cell wall-associated NlpC family hydrolase
VPNRVRGPGTALLAVLTAVALLVAGSAVLLGLVALAGLGGTLAASCAGDGGTGGGAAQVGARRWTAEQTANAQTIVQVAVRRGLPRRAAVIAVSTAIVESGLRNVGHGDRDSLGLFQQRPSQGWGVPAELLNPALAAGKFYDALLAIPRWALRPPGSAAQAVQRSAFPGRYAPIEPDAAGLVARYWVGPDVPAAAGPGIDSAAAARATVACPDQGGARLPSRGGPAVDPARLPPGFPLPADPVRRTVVLAALAQVGKPYVWGAKGPDAFDCSGLTQAVWASAGVPISAGTVNQVRDGAPVTDPAAVAPGDLLFVAGSLGTAAVPRHVGIFIGADRVVDARSADRGVMISSFRDWRAEVVAIRRLGPAPRLVSQASPGAS